MRIGHGYDAHRLIDGTGIIIGGVSIPYSKALLAHSDGDVLIHALCDALLGAAGLGDIGRHFPDTDPQLKGIDSRELLRQVVDQLQARHLSISNVDVTLVAQAPKMSGFIPEMIGYLALDLQILPERINIKATTTEKMGFTGRKEGIACYAVVLINE